jgi:hypothetical protein
MLKPPSIENFDARYRICDVVFDSSNGIGALGLNENIRYMGFAVLMKPVTFLKLAEELIYPNELSFHLLKEAQETQQGWGPPKLTVDMDSLMVKGHEGRHRNILFRRMCSENILVHIESTGTKRELRARNITNEMLEKINMGLFSEPYYNRLMPEQHLDPFWQKRYFVKGPLFSEVFIRG